MVWCIYKRLLTQAERIVIEAGDLLDTVKRPGKIKMKFHKPQKTYKTGLERQEGRNGHEKNLRGYWSRL